jgi:hypothetical protein
MLAYLPISGWLHQLVEREPLPRSADSGHQDHQLGDPMLARATSEQVQVACINCRTLEIPVGHLLILVIYN